MTLLGRAPFAIALVAGSGVHASEPSPEARADPAEYVGVSREQAPLGKGEWSAVKAIVSVRMFRSSSSRFWECVPRCNADAVSQPSAAPVIAMDSR
jgi:hypothetical protein